MSEPLTRRAVVRRSLLLAAAGAGGAFTAAAAEAEPEVTATEDLMREHGVLRRVLLAYREAAARLRAGASVDPNALADAAKLFKTFGEEYHETLLEERHIFPVVRKRGGEGGRLVDVLVAQHRRGREITDWVLASPRAGRSGGATLAGLLDAFDRMYENHAAREDTIVFPEWKRAFSAKALDEKADEFEDIEKKMFGKDGFEDAEKRISAIERTLGLSDLAMFTAPAPPAASGSAK